MITLADIRNEFKFHVNDNDSVNRQKLEGDKDADHDFKQHLFSS